jgi:opacity protein-like surface antigen
MTASQSFKAVTDTNLRMQYGGGLQVVNLWKGLYAEGTVGWSRLTGSRVFVYEGTVYDLNIPTTITFIPVEAGGGWRFRHGRTVHSYIGGGVEILKYQEQSDFAEAGDDVDEVFTGFYVAGGVEIRLARWLHLRGEGRYTGVPNALGAGGVSADFDETNLGGAAVAVKLAIGK